MTTPLRARARARNLLLAALALVAFGCDDDGGDDRPADLSWQIAGDGLGAALLSVHGTASDDVWVVGADDGRGPILARYDGASWTRLTTGVRGNLWWIHAFADGVAYAAGSEGMVLRVEDGEVTRLASPALGKQVIYGLWGAASDDVWAVGSTAGRNGFVWRYDGERWTEMALPAGLPVDEHGDIPDFFKVWGTGPDDVWVVGSRGVVLHFDGDAFARVPSGTEERLFTVHGDRDHVYIVGGGGSGVLLQGNAARGLEVSTPTGAPLLQGVCATLDGGAYAVGQGGRVYRAHGAEWARVDLGIEVDVQSLHAAWVDPEGNVWAVGGNVLVAALDEGVVLRGGGGAVAPLELPGPEAPPTPSCEGERADPHPEGTAARRWNEANLNAIRRDVPRPGVHARNLFHTSVAMWDAWAAYDEVADGVVFREKVQAPADLEAARAEAISYAAWRVLRHRYQKSKGGELSLACFDALLSKMGYDPANLGVEGDGARALGNRIGEAVIAEFADDGANETDDYADTTGYMTLNPPMVVDVPGTVLEAPAHWQKIILAKAVTQNGIELDTGLQPYIGPNWGKVRPFALERPAPDSVYFPGYHKPAFDEDIAPLVVEIIQAQADVDFTDGETLDISPGAYGNNSLGANDGPGHPVNGATGQPYAPNVVPRGDFRRVIAEFWADGPDSETPPGHWNTLANYVSDRDAVAHRLRGEGETLDRLEWDVKLYLAVNGATHDAAVAAWELKREEDSARPISLVRYMGGLGQRSDETLPSYHVHGLPLHDGLVELVTEGSSAPGERHAHLARYVGEIAVRGWRGEPGDRDAQIGGVDWIRAVEWQPYQRRTFVTPAFPGYISGHSTFSRAAAEVLTEFTGSPWFPAGLGTFLAKADEYLFFERGPSVDIELQWGTYFDAADQAGQSRIWGGIHVTPDDYDGRRIGAEVGQRAFALALTYFDGTAHP